MSRKQLPLSSTVQPDEHITPITRSPRSPQRIPQILPNTSNLQQINLPTNCQQVIDVPNMYVNIIGTTIDQDRLGSFIEILQDEQLSTCSDGVYLWMLATKNNSKHLFFTKPRTIYEIGTKHMHMVKKIEPDIIHLAGEFRLDNNILSFNYLSGTYSDKITYPNTTILATSKRFFAYNIRFRYNVDNMKIIYDDSLAQFNKRQEDDTQPSTLLIPSRLTVTVDDLLFFVINGISINYFISARDCNNYNSTYRHATNLFHEQERQRKLLEKRLNEPVQQIYFLPIEKPILTIGDIYRLKTKYNIP